MNLQDILLGGGGATVAILTIIQISKIQINPWSWIARAIGNALTTGVMERVEKNNKDLDDRSIERAIALEKKMDDLQGSFKKDLANLANEMFTLVSESEATQARYRILRFNDEILSRVSKHSKEHFEQILEMIDDYEAYCDQHPNYQNSKCVMAIENIKAVYAKACKDNDFAG